MPPSSSGCFVSSLFRQPPLTFLRDFFLDTKIQSGDAHKSDKLDAQISLLVMAEKDKEGGKQRKRVRGWEASAAWIQSWCCWSHWVYWEKLELPQQTLCLCQSTCKLFISLLSLYFLLFVRSYMIKNRTELSFLPNKVA